MSWFATSDLFTPRAPPQSGFALASGSRYQALTIRLTLSTIETPTSCFFPSRISDHRITRCPDHPINLAGPLGFELEPLSRRPSLLAKS
jgi:hypothetical protein